MHRLACRGLAALGGLLLLVAAVEPWMSVPSGFATRPDGTATCLAQRPRSAIPFRATCAGFAVVMGLGHAWHRRTSDRKAMAASAALAVQLFFPCVVMAWEPGLSARANWLQVQHENLTWLGGDLCTNLEFSRKSWKDRIYLVDTPRQINVVRMPSSGLGAFQFGRAIVWFETLGYSNRFCQFVNRGWAAALFGMTALILAECLPGGRLDRRRAILSSLAFSAACLVGVLLVAVPVVSAARALERARSESARGRFDAAGRRMAEAVRALPALREDTFHVAQSGLIDFRRGRTWTPEGRLFAANLRERQGRYAEAISEYLDLLDDAPRESAVRREALRGVLRFGTHALNGGRAGRAIEWLERVIEEEPCNLKANYALQLAYLRVGRRADVDRMVGRIEKIYAYFQMPNKEIVLAMSRENALFAALRDGDAAAVGRAVRRARRP